MSLGGSGGLNAGSVYCQIEVKTDKAVSSLETFNRGLDKSAKDSEEKFGRIKKAAQAASTGMLVVAGAGVTAMGYFVKSAMAAVESENLFSVSLGKNEASARAWSQSLRKELGLNEYELRKQVGMWYTMLNSIGLNEKAALGMSEGLVKLAYDMASFYNLKPDEAFQKLKSGIMGEIEPLRQLGIVVDETTAKNWALTQGMTKKYENMTQGEKAEIRYRLILEQTSKAQGDLARTMDSPTNKLRIMGENAKQTSIEIGMQLLPAANKLLDIGNKLATSLGKMTDAQKASLANWLLYGTVTMAAVGGLTKVALAIPPLITLFGQLRTAITLSGLLSLGAIALPAALGVGALFGLNKMADDMVNAKKGSVARKKTSDQLEDEAYKRLGWMLPPAAHFGNRPVFNAYIEKTYGYRPQGWGDADAFNRIADQIQARHKTVATTGKSTTAPYSLMVDAAKADRLGLGPQLAVAIKQQAEKLHLLNLSKQGVKTEKERADAEQAYSDAVNKVGQIQVSMASATKASADKILEKKKAQAEAAKKALDATHQTVKYRYETGVQEIAAERMADPSYDNKAALYALSQASLKELYLYGIQHKGVDVTTRADFKSIANMAKISAPKQDVSIVKAAMHTLWGIASQDERDFLEQAKGIAAKLGDATIEAIQSERKRIADFFGPFKDPHPNYWQETVSQIPMIDAPYPGGNQPYGYGTASGKLDDFLYQQPFNTQGLLGYALDPKNAKPKAPWQPGSLSSVWQSMTGKFQKQNPKTYATATGLYDLYQNFAGMTTTNKAEGQQQGMMAGAGFGATFGPVGAVAGGLLGGIFGGMEAAKRAAEESARQRAAMLAELRKMNNALLPVSDYFRQGMFSSLTSRMTWGGLGLSDSLAAQTARGAY